MITIFIIKTHNIDTHLQIQFLYNFKFLFKYRRKRIFDDVNLFLQNIKGKGYVDICKLVCLFLLYIHTYMKKYVM